MEKKRGIVEWAMHYRQIVILVTCCLVAFGIYSLPEMQKNEFPDFTIPLEEIVKSGVWFSEPYKPFKRPQLYGWNLVGSFLFWRKDRDSNPGNSCPFTAFRVRPDRPLRHLSLFGGQSYNFFVIRERKVPKKYGEIVR